MSKTDGAIIIGAEARIDTLVLKVRDFGPGLPMSYKDKANHLFEKFTRGENESSKRGAGLGLAICNAIVDAHKGKISVTPANGGGVEFTVILPRSAPPELPIANS